MKRVASLLLLFVASTLSAQPFMPDDHRALTRTISYDDMKTFLGSVDGRGPVRVTTPAMTTKGRPLFVVNLRRSERPSWKILFYAQQHGDEISGKDALLYLIRDIARNPSLLPRDVDLWIIPSMNPDGAEAGTRVNGAGADLNRDHIALEQPETQMLHRIVREVRPDVAVDCHEFARDSESYQSRGWSKWPDITMDALNNPLFDPAVIAAGERWVREAAKAEADAGHRFLRYWVGGVPPDEEQRHSAPDIDSGLNAVGMYGGLSFIIEAAARRGDEAIARELGKRVDAYLVLLRRFVAGDGQRKKDAAAIRSSRARAFPSFIPTNYLWVNPTAEVTKFPVLVTATGAELEVPTPNMMTRLVVKKSVPAPAAYAIDARAAEAYAAVLDRHGIGYETLSTPRTAEGESCKLLRVEEEFDELYSRYEGRQIVTRQPAARREFPAGTLWVPLRGEAAVRVALVLEPMSLYGLYQYPRYRALAAADGVLPVSRIVR